MDLISKTGGINSASALAFEIALDDATDGGLAHPAEGLGAFGEHDAVHHGPVELLVREILIFRPERSLYQALIEGHNTYSPHLKAFCPSIKL